MSHRESTEHRRDAAIFTRTAKQTKKVNIAPKIMRGGIRF